MTDTIQNYLTTSYAAMQEFIDLWMVQIFLIILFFAILNFVQKRVLRKLHEKATASKLYWDDAVIIAMTRPLTLFIWVIGIGFAADIIYAHTQAPIFSIVTPLRYVAVICCLFWFALRLTYQVENYYLENKPETDVTSVTVLAKLIRLSLTITGVLIVLQTLGISISGVLAFGGIGGIAIGFAAKDLLANFFGAFMIYMDRPFEVGHWIRSPDKEIEGVVEDIGWRLTRIRTFEKRLLYVPNSMFTSIVVENPSRMSNRRIKEVVGVRYDDIKVLPGIVQGVKDMLHNHPEVDHDQVIIVNFDEFSSSSLNFFIYVYTKTTNWIKYHQIKQDVLLQVANVVESHGAEFAFPTSTIHIPDEVILSQAADQKNAAINPA